MVEYLFPLALLAFLAIAWSALRIYGRYLGLFVMGMFWWHLVWVGSGLIRPFGVAYWAGIGLLAAIQLAALLRLTWSLLLRREVRIAGVDD